MNRSSVIILVLAGLFALQVIIAARRRRTHEWHTILWLMVSVVTAALAIWRPAIDEIASAMGIYYPPSALFLACLSGLLWLVYRLSLEVADQRRAIRRLVQEVAILNARAPSANSVHDDAVPARAS
ncbi:MAG: DUF2304 domain-containing protein [Myxococcota bacterium]